MSKNLKKSVLIKWFINKRVHLIALVFFMLIGGIGTVRRGQDVSFDIHNYHYNNPHAFIKGKTLENIGVSGIQSYENPLRDVPAYLLMSNLSPKKAGFILGAIQGINLWLIFEILLISLSWLKMNLRRRVFLGFVIAGFSLLGSGFYSELGTTMGDNTTSILVLLAVLLYLHSVARQAPASKKYRLLAFIVLGMSVGLKLTNIMYVFGLFFADLLIMKKGPVKQYVKQIISGSSALAVGILFTGGYWFTKMWLTFGNPIFPFYNGIFKSEYYPSVNFIDERWTKEPLIKSFLEPFYYVKHQALSSEVFFTDPRLAVTIILALCAVIFVGYRKHIKKTDQATNGWTKQFKVLLAFTLAAYLAWSIQFSYYRYIVVLELLSLVLIALSIFLLIKKSWVATVIVITLCFLITLRTVQTSWGRVPWQAANFGVTEADFRYLENSTVLISGYQPFSFLIPYFPDSTRTLRIVSDLSSPKMGTAAMQDLLKKEVGKRKAAGSTFYGIRVDEEVKISEDAFEEFGFKVSKCEEIPVTVRQHTPNKYRICKLDTI